MIALYLLKAKIYSNFIDHLFENPKKLRIFYQQQKKESDSAAIHSKLKININYYRHSFIWYKHMLIIIKTLF